MRLWISVLIGLHDRFESADPPTVNAAIIWRAMSQWVKVAPASAKYSPVSVVVHLPLCICRGVNAVALHQRSVICHVLQNERHQWHIFLFRHIYKHLIEDLRITSAIIGRHLDPQQQDISTRRNE